MKRFSILGAALACVLGYLAPPAAVADDLDKKTVVTLNAPTEVPGIVLQPGTYVIKLLNSSSNRHIAEIMNERMDHLYALTFTAAAQRIEPASKTVLTFYEETNGRPQALKRWFWPSDTVGQEFIYPKEQAERISAATKQKVPEGKLPTLAESGQKLNPDNAADRSLESSKSSTVSERNELTQPDTIANATEPPVIAQNTAPQRQVDRDDDNKPKSDSTSSVAPAPATSQDTTQADNAPVTSASNDSSDRTLPQTASQLPLIVGVGIVSFALALLVGLIRRQSTSAL